MGAHTHIPPPCPTWVPAPVGALVWQRFSPLPHHPCGVAVVLREQRSGSEGRDRLPALLCLTWGKSWAGVTG